MEIELRKVVAGEWGRGAVGVDGERVTVSRNGKVEQRRNATESDKGRGRKRKLAPPHALSMHTALKRKPQHHNTECVWECGKVLMQGKADVRGTMRVHNLC